MNILFTSHRFSPDIGGIESVSMVLARYLVAAGHNLLLVTHSLSSSIAEDSIYPFKIVRRPSPLRLLHCYMWSDIVVQSNIELRQYWPQLFFRRPALVILHTWLRSSKGHRRFVDRLKQIVLLSASQVVSISEAIRQDSFPNSIVIGNPYDSKLFRRLPEIQKQKSIAFLGRLVSDKGVDLLLQSFYDIPQSDWHLYIIGSGPEAASLERLSVQLNLSANVHFLGALQGDVLVRELNRHQLMVIPSRWREPFGVVALEGLACGCVLLASDGGGLSDAVGSAGLLFMRGCRSDLTQKLESLLENEDLRDQLAREAPAHLIHFDENSVCSRYLELIECILAKSSKGSR